jgi:hypothetical protein
MGCGPVARTRAVAYNLGLLTPPHSDRTDEHED